MATAVAHATAQAEKEGKALALDAAKLVSATLATAEKFICRVDSMLEKGNKLNSGELRQTAGTWEIAVDTARKALGMDAVEQPLIQNRITVVNCVGEQMRILADELESRKAIVDVDVKCDRPCDSEAKKHQ